VAGLVRPISAARCRASVCAGKAKGPPHRSAEDSSAGSDTDHGAFAPRAIYLREPSGVLSFRQELYMRNQLHELSIDDLDEVSGGILIGPSLTPSIPIPPPVPGLLGPGPVIPGGHGSFDPALLQ
jgi:hypothetical protein